MRGGRVVDYVHRTLAEGNELVTGLFIWLTKGKPGGKWVNPPTEHIELIAL